MYYLPLIEETVNEKIQADIQSFKETNKECRA